MAMGNMKLMLDDYRLTTAEILYHLPDYPSLLQSYVWQQLDRVPDFPRLNGFLAFWARELDGRLHSVRVATVGVLQPAEWRYSNCLVTIH